MVVPSELRRVERWCKHCQHSQPLRVRHCSECGRCVATFDHHCPWMGTCIGEKNRPLFVLYLILQTTQLQVLFVTLLTADSAEHWRELMIAELVVGGLAFFAGVSVGFQFYLIAKGLTTWEYLRWGQIEYLLIFDR